MNKEKSDAYKKLVAEMQNQYPHFDKNSDAELFAPFVDGENICQEINLYTYWQGFGYAKNTPKIKYLLVAQDWGNPFNDENKLVMERINKMNDGDKTVNYFGDEKVYNTDKNLIELFEVLGYKNIKDNRYDDLFFTNFCLRYRSGKQAGGMTKKIMMNDAEEFKRLCEILEPENILCLGKITAECAYEALTGDGTWKEIYGGFKNYNDFLENHAELTVNCGNSVARFFPLAHCGGMGTANRNRNRNLPKENDPLYYQKDDWKKISR